MKKAALLLVLFIPLAVHAKFFPLSPLDPLFTLVIQSHPSPVLDAFMIGVTTAGSSLVLTPLTVALSVLLYIRRNRRKSVLLLSTMGGSAVLTVTLKQLIGRPRPDPGAVRVVPPELASKYAQEFGFPSGHTLASTCFFGFVIYLLLKNGNLRNPKVLLLISLILLVGISRVYLGAHWITDVIGGWIIGACWLDFNLSFDRD